jgi:hypothetical protein
MTQGKEYFIFGYKNNLSFYENQLKETLTQRGFITGESFKVLYICPLIKKSFLLELAQEKIGLSSEELSILHYQ